MSNAVRLGVVVAAIVALPLFALMGIGGASPTPEYVCTPCRAVDDDDLGETRVTIDVTPDGDAEWHIELSPADETVASAWREEAPVSSSDVRDSYSSIADDHHDPSVAVADDGDVHVEFTDSGAVDRSVGDTLVVDSVDETGAARSKISNVDRLEIEPPDGYAVATTHDDASPDETGVTWSEADGESFDEVVVFVPADASAPDARATVAVGLAAAPVVAENLLLLAVPTAVFGGLLYSTTVAVRSVGPDRATRPVVAAAAGASLVGVWGLWSVRPVGVGVMAAGPWLLVVAFLLLGVALARRQSRRWLPICCVSILLFAGLLIFRTDLTGVTHGLTAFAFLLVAVGTGILAVPLVATGTFAAHWHRTRE